MLLLRVGDAASRRRFAGELGVDRLVFLLRGCRVAAAARPSGLAMDLPARRPRLPGRAAADVRGHAVRERAARRHASACAGATPEPGDARPAGIEALAPHRGTMCLVDRHGRVGQRKDRMRRRRPSRSGPSAASRSGLMAPRRSSTRPRRLPCTGACWRGPSGRRRRRATWRARARSGSLPGASTTCLPPGPAARRRRAPGGEPAGSSTPSGSSRRRRDRLRAARGRARTHVA